MYVVTEVNGTTFCDWRFNVHNCEDSEFFFVAQLFCFATAMVALVLFFFALFIRVVILKDRLASFFYGANGALLLFLIVIIVFSVQAALVLFSGNDNVARIFWSFLYPICFSSSVFYLVTILKALPELTHLKAHSQSWFAGSKGIYGVVISYTLLVLCNIVLFPTAAAMYKQGLDEYEAPINRAALFLFCINVLMFWLYFLRVASFFLSLIQSQLEDLNGTGNELMALTLRKLKQNILTVCWNGLMTLIFHLTLACYPYLFVNLPLSKAMIILNLDLVSLMAIPTAIVALILDIQRVQKKYGKKTTSDKKSSSFTEKTPRVHQTDPMEQITMQDSNN